MEDEFLLGAKRPLSYAEIVASNPAIHHKSAEDVNPPPTSQHPQQQQQQQDVPREQSNTLPRSKGKPRGGGQNRYRTLSGSFQDSHEGTRPAARGSSQRGGFGRGGNRGAGGQSGSKPQFQGGISRDNPQYHTFPRSRRRQAPDPERYEPTTSRGGHMGPSQRRIMSRRSQQQKDQQQQQQQQQQESKEEVQETQEVAATTSIPEKSYLSFSQILKSKSSSSIPQPHQAKPKPAPPVVARPVTTVSHTNVDVTVSSVDTEPIITKQYTKSYASTLASGLEALLIQQAQLAQRRPITKTDTHSVYKSQPMLVLRDPWSDQPPPLIPGLRFRPTQQLERRNSKKQKQPQEEIQEEKQIFHDEIAPETQVLETQTLKRRRSKKKRTPAKRSKSCGDVDKPEDAFHPLNSAMKSHQPEAVITNDSLHNLEETPLNEKKKPVRRRSKKYQKKENEVTETVVGIKEKEIKKLEEVTTQQKSNDHEQTNDNDNVLEHISSSKVTKEKKPKKKENHNEIAQNSFTIQTEEKCLNEINKAIATKKGKVPQETVKEKEIEKEINQTDEKSSALDLKLNLKPIQILESAENNAERESNKPKKKKHVKNAKNVITKDVTMLTETISKAPEETNKNLEVALTKDDETKNDKPDLGISKHESGEANVTEISKCETETIVTSEVELLEPESISSIETGPCEVCIQTEAPVAFVENENIQSLDCTSCVNSESTSITQENMLDLIVEKTPEIHEDIASYAQIAASNQSKLALSKEDNPLEDGSDIEVMQSPALIVEVINSVSVTPKNIDKDGFETIVSKKKQLREKKNSSLAEDFQTTIDIVEDILNADIERSQKELLSFKQTSIEKISNSSEDEFCVIDEFEPKSQECKVENEIVIPKNAMPLAEQHKTLLNEEALKEMPVKKGKEKTTTKPEKNTIISIPERGAEIFDLTKIVNQGSSISSFDESQGINTGEEELYWRIKEKVKKKKRRPKQTARESSTESESEITNEIQTQPVKIPENIMFVKNEETLPELGTNDEAAHGADVEDNVSVGKIAGSGPADEVVSENDDFISVDLNEEMGINSTPELKKSWATIASLPIRPSTPLPEEIPSAYSEKHPIVIISDEVNPSIPVADKDGFEVVASKRHRRTSAKTSASDQGVENETLPSSMESKINLEENILAPDLCHVDEDDEDSCPIEPFMEDSDKDEQVIEQPTVVKNIAVANDEPEEDSCPIEPFMNDTDEEDLPLEDDDKKCNGKINTTNAENEEPNNIPVSVEEKIAKTEIDIERVEDDDEDSCPIEPFMEDSEKEEDPNLDSENVLKCQLTIDTSDDNKVKQSNVKANECLEEDEEDSCPIEPFLEDSESEEQGEDLKLKEDNNLSIQETSTKIIGILEKLSTIVNKNTDKIEADLMSEIANVSFEKEKHEEVTCIDHSKENSPGDDEDSCPIEPFLEDSDTEIQIETSVAKIEEQLSLSKVDTKGEESEEDSCPIEPFLEDSENELVAASVPVTTEKPNSSSTVDAKVKENNDELAPTLVPVATDETDSPSRVDAKEEESDEDSCPIEPFLEDSEHELVATSVPVSTEKPNSPLTVDSKMKENDKKLASTSASVATEKLNNDLAEDAKEEESDEDSCPIEPFLDDSENELVATSVPVSTEKPNSQLTVDSKMKENNKKLASTSASVATEKLNNDLAEDAKDVESDEDSCPIEPFLEESDNELTVETTKVFLNEEPQSILPKDTEQEDSDEDSCAIEPFLEDSDSESAVADANKAKEEENCSDIKTTENVNFQEKSWADIASTVKSVQVVMTEKEKSEAINLNEGIPSVVAIEESKINISEPVDPDGFKTVYSKKDRKRTRTLSFKSGNAVLEDSNDVILNIQESPEENKKYSYENNQEKIQCREQSSYLSSTEKSSLVIQEDNTVGSQSWARVVTTILPPKEVSGTEKANKPCVSTSIPDIFVAKDTEKTSTFVDIDEDGFKVVHSKAEKRRSRILSTNSTTEETPEVITCQLNESENKLEKQLNETNDTFTREENNTDDSKQNIDLNLSDDEDTPGKIEEGCTTLSWAKVASIPTLHQIIQTEETLQDKHQTKENKLPDIIVITNDKGDDSSENIEDPEGFRTVQTKKDRKRTRTISLKSGEEVCSEVEKSEPIHLEKEIEEKFPTQSEISQQLVGKEVEIEKGIKVIQNKNAVGSTPEVEDPCITSSWAKVVSSTCPTLENEMTTTAATQPKETKIPEIRVASDNEDIKVSDKADENGFQIVHSKKDRKRTRTLSTKSITNSIQETQTGEETKSEVEPIPKVDKPEVRKVRPEQAEDDVNFQVRASKVLSVPVAEDCKPPDPHRYLRREHYWTNKLECEEAEVKWQIMNAKLHRSNKDEKASKKNNDDDDDSGSKPDKSRKESNEDNDKPGKSSKELFQTVDTSSDHPMGKGNWSDESTYLSLDPVSKLESESESSETENCDSGYNSLRRGTVVANHKLAFEDQKDFCEKIIDRKSSEESAKFKDKLDAITGRLLETDEALRSVGNEGLDEQFAINKIVSKCLESVESDLIVLSINLLENSVLFSTTSLPLDLIRVQIRLKDQQVLVESQSSKLANLMQLRNERRKEVRRFREFLAELEDWLIQTEISVSAEVKILSRKLIADDIRVIETLDEAMKARSRHLEDLSVQCRPLTTDATVSGQALPLFQQLVGLRSALDDAQETLKAKMQTLQVGK